MAGLTVDRLQQHCRVALRQARESTADSISPAAWPFAEARRPVEKHPSSLRFHSQRDAVSTKWL